MASKAFKTIALTAKSSSHDVDTKLRNIVKWLKAGHSVKVELSGKPDKHKALEDLLYRVESDTKPGAAVAQKTVKAGLIKLVMKPTPGAANLKVRGKEEDNSVDDMTVDTNTSFDDLEKQLNDSIKDEISKHKAKWISKP